MEEDKKMQPLGDNALNNVAGGDASADHRIPGQDPTYRYFKCPKCGNEFGAYTWGTNKVTCRGVPWHTFDIKSDYMIEYPFSTN
ncbi:MAG: hypothetical protein K6F31_11515 [Acetatifactor sp.]|nr:hypothetical protein [Acetatifactor sp.]